MNFKIMLTAGLALALAGCTTTSGGFSVAKQNAVEAHWVGQSAGKFFAQFGPPISDVQSGGSTVYSWRGGYKTRTIAASKTSKSRTQYLRCQVELTVSSDYVIQSVKPVINPQLADGKTWCEEFLGGA